MRACVRACVQSFVRALLCFAPHRLLSVLFVASVSLAVSLAPKKKEMARTRLQKSWDSLLPSHAFTITISSMNCLVSNALDPGITTNEREEDMVASSSSSSSSSVKKCTTPYNTNIIVAFNNNNSSNNNMEVLLVLFFCCKSLLVYPPLVSSIA